MQSASKIRAENVAGINTEMVSLAKTLARVEKVCDYMEANPFPAGAEWRAHYSDMRYGSASVSVPLVDGRSWRGMDGTAGIIYRLRKWFGIDKLARRVNSDGSLEFSGYGEFCGESFYLYINVAKGQLPDTCRLVEEEVTETVTRKKYRTVCN